MAVDVGKWAPAASSMKSGKSPAQRTIQFMGTPSSSEPLARSCSARERGAGDEVGFLRRHEGSKALAIERRHGSGSFGSSGACLSWGNDQPHQRVHAAGLTRWMPAPIIEFAPVRRSDHGSVSGDHPRLEVTVEPRISLVTLGVADVARARAFYEALGWHAASR